MIDIPLPPPVWINRSEDLIKTANDLRKYQQIAIDTESNSLFAYQEQVCLIQVSTPERDYLIDTLAISDLSTLEPILSNPGIEKIFHAAEYDLICLKRDFGISLKNLFDTMQAARILGRTAVGLGSVLEAEFGIVLDKRYQRANWGQRPLPAPMLNYARFDSHYLIPLRERMAEALHAADRWALAVEDFERISDVTLPPENGHDPCGRINGSRDLNPQQAAVLKELCIYRDLQARRGNMPPFKVLSNEMLVETAQLCPETVLDLPKINSLPAKLRDRHGAELVAAVKRGLKAAPVYRTTHPRPSDEYLNRLERLREWRKKTAQALGVESDVVLPRETLETIAESCPKSLEDVRNIMAALPWRLEQYGCQILGVLHKG